MTSVGVEAPPWLVNSATAPEAAGGPSLSSYGYYTARR
jgi:hypothetical protein